MRWFFAAYRLGGWPAFERGMTSPEFVARIYKEAERHNDIWTLSAKTSRGTSPVGVIAAIVDRGMVWARVVWFPWASLRNKLECSLKFAREIGRNGIALYIAPQNEKEFMNHLARYGVVKRVGTIDGAFPDEAGALFQSRSL